jgi:hypothetical protein
MLYVFLVLSMRTVYFFIFNKKKFDIKTKCYMFKMYVCLMITLFQLYSAGEQIYKQ